MLGIGGLGSTFGAAGRFGAKKWLPLIGAKQPMIYAKFLASDQRYYAAGRQQADFAAFLAALSGTFTRGSVGTDVVGGLVTSFASGAPRLGDHGLLLEGARTNLLLTSEDFTSGNWVKTNGGGSVTITADAIAAPNGLLTADKIVEAADTGLHDAARTTTAANGTYTASGYFKAGERTIGHIRTTDGATGGYGAIIDLATGLVTLDASAPGSCTGGAVSVVALANGWYRVILTFTTAAGTSISVAYGPQLSAASAVTATYLGVAGNGLYVWGAQLEAAPFVGSYIGPTASVALARAADSFSHPFALSEFTLVLDFRTAPGTSNFHVAWGCDDGTDSNYSHVVRSVGGGLRCNVVAAGVDQGGVSLGSNPAANTNLKVALGVKLNDFGASRAGAAVVLDSVATIPTFTTARPGQFRGGSSPWSSHLRSMALYSFRTPDAQLQAAAA